MQVESAPAEGSPSAKPKTPHPIVLDAIRVLTQEGDRSTAPAKLRLAMQIGYNIYSIGHWEAGRRQPCEDAIARMDAVIAGRR
jgi:hypothetical protein